MGTSSTPIEAFHFALFQSGREMRSDGRCRCPGHDGNDFNLAVAEGDDGRVLLTCHSHGCTVEQICSGLGIHQSTLFPRNTVSAARNGIETKRLIAVPTGSDTNELLPPDENKKLHATPQDAANALLWSLKENGTLKTKRPPDSNYLYFRNLLTSVEDTLFVTLRWDLNDVEKEATGETKAIRQISRVDGGWQCGNRYSSRPLFALYPNFYLDFVLPDVADAETVYVCEGEKACIALLQIGVNAVAPSQGAHCPQKTDWIILDGKRVIVMPDHDDAGDDFARRVVRLIATQAPHASVEVKCIADDSTYAIKPKDDAHDWCEFYDSKSPEWLQEKLGELPNQIQRYVTADNHPADLAKPAPDWEFKSVWNVIANPVAMREVIIDGLVRRGEVANLIAATKVGKSWLAVLLCLSVASGRPWLGRSVRKGRVLLVDNELHDETIQNRIAAVADSANIDASESPEQFEYVVCRGEAVGIDHVEKQLERYKPNELTLVVLDAKYRFFDGMDENSNTDQTYFHNGIDRIAKKLNCVIVLVHHVTKGEQGKKSVTDLGSGGGAQSRTVDCHLVIRSHSDGAELAVLDAAVRTFAPVESQTIRWQFPLWTLASEITPSVAIDANHARRENEKKTQQANIIEMLRLEPNHTLSESKLSGGHPERKSFRASIRELREDGLIESVDGYIPPRSKKEAAAWRWCNVERT